MNVIDSVGSEGLLKLSCTVNTSISSIVFAAPNSKNGTSVSQAKVEVEKIVDGTARSIGSGYTNYRGEFSFSQPEGVRHYRVTATYKNSTATKDIEVTTAAIYRMALNLDIAREEKPD